VKSANDYLSHYINEQAAAERMLPMVGQLYRLRGVIVTVFGRKLLSASTIDIIKAHRLARQTVQDSVSVEETIVLLEAIVEANPGSCRIDLGQLTIAARKAGNLADGEHVASYVKAALADIAATVSLLEEPRDIVLYGFGRIGRIMARLLIERTTSANPLRLRAIVVRGGRDGDLQKRASLLRRDSIHGPFNGHIKVDEENSAIIANGNYIKVIYANQPEDIDYREYDIDNALIIDNTGIFKDEAALSRHLVPGASRVLLTAPAGGAIKNIACILTPTIRT